MEQFVQQIINATIFTPELLSWKLLLDDKINFLEHDIMAIDPDANFSDGNVETPILINSE